MFKKSLRDFFKTDCFLFFVSHEEFSEIQSEQKQKENVYLSDWVPNKWIHLENKYKTEAKCIFQDIFCFKVCFDFTFICPVSQPKKNKCEVQRSI